MGKALDRWETFAEAALYFAAVRCFWPMVGAGVASVPLVYVGLYLQRDWLVTTALWLGYAFGLWGIGILWFMVIAGLIAEFLRARDRKQRERETINR